MFIQTEDTPNPQTLKFLPGRAVMLEGNMDFETQEQSKTSPLAQKLFEISGISKVFFGSDFISITKSENQSWMALKPSILGTLMDYFLVHDHVEVKDSSQAVQNLQQGEDAEIIKEIIELLENRIRPYVAQDGGDITFERFEAGVVYVRLKGACSGCPSSSLTLKSGIENMLKHYIPEVTEVRAL